MSKMWLVQAITLVALGGLGVQWWRGYRQHRVTDARSWLQRLRAWRLYGLGMLLVGLLLELARFDTALIGRILLAVGTLGLGGGIVAVTWLALAAHRRYPGLVLHLDTNGDEHQRDGGRT
jgi:hypothetical protein